MSLPFQIAVDTNSAIMHNCMVSNGYFMKHGVGGAGVAEKNRL